MPKNTPIFQRKQAMDLVNDCWNAENVRQVIDAIRKHTTSLKRPDSAWETRGREFIAWLERGISTIHNTAPYAIFVKGNSKLPFYAFSCLPIVTCPGKGDCVNFCYSLKAWQYPQAFFRQLQNTMIIKFGEWWRLLQAFNALRDDTTVRLYVDGDFDSLSTVESWFNILKTRPNIKAYGYSKSFNELKAYGENNQYPTNYMLNLSNGASNSSDRLQWNEVDFLPISRGRFIVVNIDQSLITPNRFSLKLYHDAVRQEAERITGKKAFSCRGKCGECLPNGEHACGNDRFQDVVIAIGNHGKVTRAKKA